MLRPQHGAAWLQARPMDLPGPDPSGGHHCCCSHLLTLYSQVVGLERCLGVTGGARGQPGRGAGPSWTLQNKNGATTQNALGLQATWRPEVQQLMRAVCRVLPNNTGARLLQTQPGRAEACKGFYKTSLRDLMGQNPTFLHQWPRPGPWFGSIWSSRE